MTQAQRDGKDVNEPSVIGPPLPSRLEAIPTPPPPTHTQPTPQPDTHHGPRKTRRTNFSLQRGHALMTKHPWGAELGTEKAPEDKMSLILSKQPQSAFLPGAGTEGVVGEGRWWERG